MHAAHSDHISTCSDSFDDIGSTTKPAIDNDLSLSVDSLDNLWQNLHGPLTLIKLAAAMIRYINHIDTMIKRNPCVFSSRYTFKHERHLKALANSHHIIPGQSCLPFAARHIGTPYIALGEIALTTTIDGTVYCEAELAKAKTNDPIGNLVNPLRITVNIKLENF